MIAASDIKALPKAGRIMRRVLSGPGLLLIMVSMLASTLVVVLPPEQSKALTLTARPAKTAAGQVRIFRDGLFAGGGTLVARNWVLTALHVLSPADLARQWVRFGVVNGDGDAQDVAHLRPLAQIVPHPEADLAMVRLTDDVPAGTWIPRLSIEPLPALGRVNPYGWAGRVEFERAGQRLFHTTATVLDPNAAGNAGHLRAIDPQFARYFPASVGPLVVNDITLPGDSGGGTLDTSGLLAGVHTGSAGFHYSDGRGRFSGLMERALYDQPVWWYRRWVESIIDGAGPSPQYFPPSDSRQLNETGGALPMTQPPQTNACNDDDEWCADPRWLQAALTGPQGVALVTCAGGETNGCTFAGTTYAPGTSVTLPLGTAGGTGIRQVLVWCASSAESSAAQRLELSFTNTDAPDDQYGYGWWFVTRDFVRTDRGYTSDLSAC
jgi:hypothetical protein